MTAALTLSGANVMNDEPIYDTIVERGGRVKPCGGAIPPRLIQDFAIPDEMLAARVTSARMFAPSDRIADMPIENGFVGMVDRQEFDEWLRARAGADGATLRTGLFEGLSRNADGIVILQCREKGVDGAPFTLRARSVIGADGARSGVARAAGVKGADRMRYVFAYHEIVRSPTHGSFDPARCEVHYKGCVSPDFYGWVFPHGATTSVGLGSANKGFALRRATTELREATGLAGAETLRREGAPIPLKPLKRWDDGESVLLAGDAAGVVAPASGEGIYYAMLGGQLAGEAVERFLATGDARALRDARDHAALLVHQRQAAGAVRDDLPRPGCAAADLGRLHDQGIGPGQAAYAFADLLQEHGPFDGDSVSVILTIIIAAVATAGVLATGGALTEIGPWYYSLRNPPWRPPNWAFGPIWGIVGACTCAAAVIIWRASPTEWDKAITIVLFALNACLNVLWNVLFFKLKRPDWAMIEVVFLWLSILALIIAFYPRAPLSAAFLLPYLIWVSIASVLNRAMVQLNGPFDGKAERGGIVKGQS
jgi:geranylgeranyl reductase